MFAVSAQEAGGAAEGSRGCQRGRLMRHVETERAWPRGDLNFAFYPQATTVFANQRAKTRRPRERVLRDFDFKPPSIPSPVQPQLRPRRMAAEAFITTRARTDQARPKSDFATCTRAMRLGVPLLPFEVDSPFVEARVEFDRMRITRGPFDPCRAARHKAEIDGSEVAEIGRDGRFSYLHFPSSNVGDSTPFARDEKDESVRHAPRITIEGDRVDPKAVARLQPESPRRIQGCASYGHTCRRPGNQHEQDR